MVSTERRAPVFQETDVTYVLDTARSTLAFRARAFLLIWVDGTLEAREGRIVVRGDTVSAEGTADASSIRTGIAARDWHLRTSHYLACANHPDVTLAVESLPIAGGTVPARLRVRDGVVDFELDVDPVEFRRQEVHARARGSFDRRGLGMLPRQAGVSSRIQVSIDIVARRHQAPPGPGA